MQRLYRSSVVFSCLFLGALLLRFCGNADGQRKILCGDAHRVAVEAPAIVLEEVLTRRSPAVGPVRDVPLFSPTPPAPVAWLDRQPAAKQACQVELSATLTEEAPSSVQPGDTLRLPLFDQKDLSASVISNTRDVNGTTLITAAVDGQPRGRVLLSRTNDKVMISVTQPKLATDYLIQFDAASAKYVALEIDPEKTEYLPCQQALVPPGPGANPIDGAAIRSEGGDVQVDVMILYTPAAAAWAGGTDGINMLISQAMARSRQAHANSNTRINLRLVHSAPVNYTESGSMGTDLSRLTFSDGYMDEVFSLRDQYGADLVCLFNNPEGCTAAGIGWLYNGSAEYGMCVSRINGAAWGYTMAHEFGHNMGCHHRKDQATQPGPGHFPYSAGWRWTGDTALHASVMSYSDGGHYRVAQFSNPSITHDGRATGDASHGDNARSLRELSAAVASFRAAVPMGPVMQAEGNGQIVGHGDAYPSESDHTDFGKIIFGEGTLRRTFALRNIGEQDLVLSGSPPIQLNAACSAESFVVIKPPLQTTIAPGGLVTFEIEYTPLADFGKDEAQVIIPCNDPRQNPYTFAIKAGWNTPEINVYCFKGGFPSGSTHPSLATGTHFGNTTLGNPLTRTFTINNYGGANLVLTGTPKIAISGKDAPDFTLVTEPESIITPGSATTFTLQLNPTRTGPREARISIPNSDLDEDPFWFDIKGVRDPLTHVPVAVAKIDSSTPSPQAIGDTIVLSGADSYDPDEGDTIVDYGWVQLSGPPVALDTTDPIRPRFVPDVNAKYVFRLRVTDNNQDSSYDIPSDGPFILPGGFPELYNEVTVVVGGLSAPNPITPTQSSMVFGPVIDFRWSQVPGADYYYLEVWDYWNWRLLYAGSTTDTSYLLPRDPNSFGHHWRVRAYEKNTQIRSEWSEEVYFETAGVDIAVRDKANYCHIDSGDTTPSRSDSTDFGKTTPLGGIATHEFYLQNCGNAATLQLTGTPAVSISGPHASDFVVVAHPVTSLDSWDSTTFQIRFSPVGIGVRRATVTIPSNDPDEPAYTFHIQGDVGNLTPPVLTAPTAGQLFSGATATIQWNATAEADRYELEISDQQTDEIVFSGTTTATSRIVGLPQGVYNYRCRVKARKGEAQYSNWSEPVHFKRTGSEIQVQYYNTIIESGTTAYTSGNDFGYWIELGKYATRDYRIWNLGATDLVLTGISPVELSGPQAGDFAITRMPEATIAPGTYDWVRVKYTPSAIGYRQAYLTLRNNDADEATHTFPLCGGARPAMLVRSNVVTIGNGDMTPSSVDQTHLGNMAIDGTPLTRTFVIENTGHKGGGELLLTGNPKVEIVGLHAADFTVVSEPASPLINTAITKFSLRFTPTALGTRKAVVRIASNDPGCHGLYEFAICAQALEKIINGPPIAVAKGSAAKWIAGELVVLDGSDSYDPDGDSIVAYTWLQLAGPTVSPESNGTSFAAFQATKPGAYVFKLVVTDHVGNDSVDASSPANTVSFTIEKPVDPPTGGTVYLFVDTVFYNALKAEVDRLAEDIARDLPGKAKVIEIDPATTTAVQIRTMLQVGYKSDGVSGSILIGDVPTAYIGDYNFCGQTLCASDAFYEDLDHDSYIDSDGNGIYNIVIDIDGDGEFDWFKKSWYLEHNREIWCGRLTPPGTVLAERTALLKAYLDRNHDYRTGARTYQRGMAYAESVAHNGSTDDGEDTYEEVYARAAAIMDNSWIWNRQQGDILDFIWSDDLAQHMANWQSGVGKNYEYGFLNVHGSVTGQWFGGSNWLYSNHYKETPANCLLVDLASCNNGDFTSSNYLGGWVLFGGGALAVNANTTVVMYVGKPKPNPDLQLLDLGLTLGETRLTYVLSNDAGVLLGDPTLRLRKGTRGPKLRIDQGSTISLPSENLDGKAKGYLQGGKLTLRNDGDTPLTVHHRITSLTSINRNRLWGNQYQSRLSVKDRYKIFPLTLQPGESRDVDLQFYYDGNLINGRYKAGVLLYTDSASSPYCWTTIQKDVTSSTEGLVQVPGRQPDRKSGVPSLTPQPPAGEPSNPITLLPQPGHPGSSEPTPSRQVNGRPKAEEVLVQPGEETETANLEDLTLAAKMLEPGQLLPLAPLAPKEDPKENHPITLIGRSSPGRPAARDCLSDADVFDTSIHPIVRPQAEGNRTEEAYRTEPATALLDPKQGSDSPAAPQNPPATTSTPIGQFRTITPGAPVAIRNTPGTPGSQRVDAGSLVRPRLAIAIGLMAMAAGYALWRKRGRP